VIPIWKTITGFPKKEFELLYFLAKNQTIVFSSRGNFFQNIWAQDVFVLSSTVDASHSKKCGEKIGDGTILPPSKA